MSALPSRRVQPAVLSGKYALFGALGSGGAGTVFRAENLLVGRTVAVKRLRPASAKDPGACVAFLSEARAAARIGHPNIVEILDLGVDQVGVPYIVMELVEGETLEQVLERRGPLPVRYACELMLQVLSAIDAAHHAGIVHRDLKPANVLVTHPKPERAVVKVVDFGVSSGLMDEDAPELGGLRYAGTPLYMAPERALGHESDARADVFSAGVMLYELLSGSNPFEADSTRAVIARSLVGDFRPLDEVAPHVPRELARAIHAAMAAKVAERTPSAAALSAELARYVDGDHRPSLRSSGVVSIEPFPLLPRFEPWCDLPEALSLRILGREPVRTSELVEPRIPPAAPLPSDLVLSGGDDASPGAPAPAQGAQRRALALALAGGLALGATCAWLAGLL